MTREQLRDVYTVMGWVTVLCALLLAEATIVAFRFGPSGSGAEWIQNFMGPDYGLAANFVVGNFLVSMTLFGFAAVVTIFIFLLAAFKGENIL